MAVHLVLDAPQEGWDGPTGFVQHHAQRLGLVTDAVSVALVGFPAMIEETKAHQILVMSAVLRFQDPHTGAGQRRILLSP